MNITARVVFFSYIDIRSKTLLSLYHKFENSEEKLNSHTFTSVSPSNSIEWNDDQYSPNKNDERDDTLRAIKARRGQPEFRKKLLEFYQNKCVITDCNFIDILEAAHISPYRGVKDNHHANGLLLRSDIHTLFDLDLIAINPESFEVEISSRLLTSEYSVFHKKKISDIVIKLVSTAALNIKWKQFISNKFTDC